MHSSSIDASETRWQHTMWVSLVQYRAIITFSSVRADALLTGERWHRMHFIVLFTLILGRSAWTLSASVSWKAGSRAVWVCNARCGVCQMLSVAL